MFNQVNKSTTGGVVKMGTNRVMNTNKIKRVIERVYAGT